jgi:hypothetical protein
MDSPTQVGYLHEPRVGDDTGPFTSWRVRWPDGVEAGVATGEDGLFMLRTVGEPDKVSEPQ